MKPYREDAKFVLHFFVRGAASTKGSAKIVTNRKTGRPIVVNDSKSAKSWQRQMASACRGEMQTVGVDRILSAPVWVDVAFRRRRPQAHFGTGKNSDVLRKKARAFPTVVPDLDKTLRVVFDALTTELLTDDSQIVGCQATKQYASEDSVHVAVHVLPETVGEMEAA